MTADALVLRHTLTALLIIAVAAAVGALLHAVLYTLGRRLALRGEGEIGDWFVAYSRRPAALILPLITIHLVFPVVTPYLHPTVFLALRHALALGLIAGVAWLIISMSRIIDDVLGLRYRLECERQPRGAAGPHAGAGPPSHARGPHRHRHHRRHAHDVPAGA